MTRRIVLLIALALLVAGCGIAGPKAKITSVEYVDTINVSGVSYKYEGQDNIQIKLDFTFDEELIFELDPASEDYRKQLFARLAEGAHFYYKDQEVKYTTGYWPQEADSNSAKEMSLFYVIPSDHSTADLRFVYDGDVLGIEGKGIDTEIKPTR